MAKIRIHRQSCELGRLPPVCICCGERATQLVRHCFHRSPTWQIFFLPVILLLIVVVGLAAAIRRQRFYDPLAGDPIDFPVPVCDSDRSRLKWHSYLLRALVAVLLFATVILVAMSISMAAGDKENARSQMRLMEAVLFTACGTGVLLLAGSMLLRLFTARVIDYTTLYIDMAGVAPGFAEAVIGANSSTLPGYRQPMGSPLTAGMSARPNVKQMAIVGGMTCALISAFCLASYVGRASTIGRFKQNAARLHERAKSWHKQVVADVQKRIADPAPGDEANDKSDEKAAGAEGPSPPPSQFVATAPDSNSFDDPVAILTSTPAASAEPPAPQRLEEFKVFGGARFPPHSREIRDTSELQPGREVWALVGLTWHRSVVVRVDNRIAARIRFPAGSRLPERPVPAMSIRLPNDADGVQSP